MFIGIKEAAYYHNVSEISLYALYSQKHPLNKYRFVKKDNKLFLTTLEYKAPLKKAIIKELKKSMEKLPPPQTIQHLSQVLVGEARSKTMTKYFNDGKFCGKKSIELFYLLKDYNETGSFSTSKEL